MVTKNPKTFVSEMEKATAHIFNTFHKVIIDSTEECFTEVIKNSPIKTGRFISSWEFSIGTTTPSTGISFVNYLNMTEDTPTEWSRKTAESLSDEFRTKVRASLISTKLGDGYFLVNNTDNNLNKSGYPAAEKPYAGKLEFGWYRGKRYTEDIDPWYVNRGEEYHLTSGGWSFKVTPSNGVLRTSFLQAPSIIKRVMERLT